MNTSIGNESNVDYSLMPLMFITYGLQYLDKITLGYAAVLGIRDDAVSTSLPDCKRELY
jgi:hypothetical protein